MNFDTSVSTVPAEGEPFQFHRPHIQAHQANFQETCPFHDTPPKNMQSFSDVALKKAFHTAQKYSSRYSKYTCMYA